MAHTCLPKLCRWQGAARRAALTTTLLVQAACARGRVGVAAAPMPADSAVGSTPAVAVAPPGGEAALVAKSLIVPVKGVDPALVRDSYSASRGARTHNALDIMAPRGTPVLAADHGLILRLSTNPAGGITIYQIDDAQSLVYYYAHLERYHDGLREGMRVQQGDVIGYVGTTGNAPKNLPHLHFQVMRFRKDRYWEGEPVNPHPYLVRQGRNR